MTGILGRIIIAVIVVLLLFVLIPLLFNIFGLGFSGAVIQVIKLCIGGIALLYVLTGNKIISQILSMEVIDTSTAASQKQLLDPSLPATTTSEEDIVTTSQRKINLIWERTQSLIALGVAGAYIYVQTSGLASPGLDAAFFLIIGFYFSRTNHAAIGGVGQKPSPTYMGR